MSTVTAVTAESQWAQIVLFTVLPCATLHSLFGVLGCWRLVLRDASALMIPLVFFVVGGVYAFLLSVAPAGGIALCHRTLSAPLTITETGIYCSILCAMIMFSSVGRVVTLYTF